MEAKLSEDKINDDRVSPVEDAAKLNAQVELDKITGKAGSGGGAAMGGGALPTVGGAKPGDKPEDKPKPKPKMVYA